MPAIHNFLKMEKSAIKMFPRVVVARLNQWLKSTFFETLLEKNYQKPKGNFFDSILKVCWWYQFGSSMIAYRAKGQPTLSICYNFIAYGSNYWTYIAHLYAITLQCMKVITCSAIQVIFFQTISDPPNSHPDPQFLYAKFYSIYEHFFLYVIKIQRI